MSTTNYQSFLRPGIDLVTSHDVAKWLLEQGEDPVWYVAERLSERLERERKAACRRGALICWKQAVKYIRFARLYKAQKWAWPEYVWPGDGDAEAWAWQSVAVDLIRCLSNVLALRAAANGCEEQKR